MTPEETTPAPLQVRRRDNLPTLLLAGVSLLLALALVVTQLWGSAPRKQSGEDSLTQALALAAREQDRADKLQTQVDELREELALAQAAAGTGEGPELLRLKVIAGLTDVKGPGVSVIMDDSDWTNTSGDEADYLIHDSDLLDVINELRSAGAEALSLNGERLLATSEVRCAGPVVTVNGVQKAAPFTIFAIGDQETLSNALTMRNGVVDILSQWGIRVKVSPSDELTIPAYTGRLSLDYLQPSLREEGE